MSRCDLFFLKLKQFPTAILFSRETTQNLALVKNHINQRARLWGRKSNSADYKAVEGISFLGLRKRNN